MKKNTFIFVLLLALITASCGSANSKAIQASGQIEATEVVIAPELSGRIVEVNVQEGDPVEAGDPLLRLDDSLLLSEKQAAQAALDSAKANSRAAQTALDTAKSQYQIVLKAELTQDEQNRTHDWFSKDPKLFDQPGWYFSRAEQIQAAQAQVDAAQKALDDAQAALTDVTKSLEKADFLKAEQRLLEARLAYLITKEVNDRAQNSTNSDQPVGRYNSTHCGTNEGYRLTNNRLANLIYTCEGDPQLADSGEKLYNHAKAELSGAQQAYDDLLNTQAAQEVLEARADVATAQEYYYAALDFLRNLQTGDHSANVRAAQGAVDQAEAAFEQAKSEVNAAQAHLGLINTQMERLVIHTPMDGVVLTRSIQPGEVIQAGMTAMTIGKIDTLKVTVYIPETEYGQVRLGQQAELSVDSFPDEVFQAKVTRIADQAEFTPQNVQTKEGRQTTVYAIELMLDNKDGRLKPGMPADVTFVNQAAAMQ